MAELRPRVWVSQPLFDDIVGRLAAHFDVQATAGVTEHGPEAIADALRDSVGALVTLNERIGPREIAGAERLRAIANVGVGYNNLDIAALTQAGIVATNTPDVLTETTADFGFALLMATARRITEAERWLREGQWQQWSFDPSQPAEITLAGEKRAFEQLIDLVTARLETHPGMHVYHYAAYEPTALKRLMGRHATREDDVDRLLRGGVLVDLYRAVRQGLRASVESYSIKKIEALYDFTRAEGLRDAGSSIVEFETWLQLGDGDRPSLARAWHQLQGDDDGAYRLREHGLGPSTQHDLAPPADPTRSHARHDAEAGHAGRLHQLAAGAHAGRHTVDDHREKTTAQARGDQADQQEELERDAVG